MALWDGRADKTSTATNLDWSNPDGNLWVAAANGDYAGMVEFVDGHFSVRNSTGAVVAMCTSIPEAQAALTRHLDTPASLASAVISPVTGRSRFGRAPRPAYLRETLAA
jgi:hypothetical protein